MAVFRIEKTRDYTVMSNHHLRDKSLSLKAKGLLSLMLSLPEEWDYTTKGLARICKDGVDSICAGVRELEEHGYVIRQRVRNPNGQLGAIEYTILEQPRPPEPGKPERENPVLDNPEQAYPVLEEPEQGNPAQLNTRMYLRSQKCWDIRQKAPDARRMSAALLGGMQANATRQMGLFGRIEQRWGVFRYTLIDQVKKNQKKIYQVRKDQILSYPPPKPPGVRTGWDGTGCGSARAIGN